MKKLLALLVAALLIVCASLALAEPVAIKALILPKFESGRRFPRRGSVLL